ncbi:MAG TPA: hypothetical protein VNZ26_06595 [Vicinamibacterales bacterium]|jgi:extracellular factor (EF) 3-hydroxypalmitic acid methyl ester biosynthesis protein|nr:hypothetical protein [Vicinamibacterales bacterium]
MTLNHDSTSSDNSGSLHLLASSQVADATARVARSTLLLSPPRKTMNTRLSVAEDEAPDSTPSPTSAVVPKQRLGQDYAELEGGQGREVFFRPQRYQRHDLGPVRPVVRVVFRCSGSESNGQAVARECALRDVSQNGVALELPPHMTIQIGAVLPELVVSFDGHEAYRGEARVGSVREADGKTIVGVSLVDSLMNIDDVLALRDVKAWVSPDAQGLGLLSAPWHVDGHETFKALTSELALFLHDAQKEFARLEASLPWHVIHGEEPSPARKALLARIHDEFVVEFIRYAAEIDRAYRLASPEDLERLKDFSRRYLHVSFLQSPCLQRAFQKPLGYPGDYEVMCYMYDRWFEGSSLFAKALNLAVMATPSVAAVRARKDLIKQQLSGLLDRSASGAPVRILAIASGPAEEIYELLRDRETVASPVEIVLFDQDTRALSFAYARLKGLVEARWSDRVRVVYLHESIKRLLREPGVFGELGRFNLVFSCGLFDYLQFRTAVTLCRNLFANLAPGGALYIGNMVPESPNRWIMELHLDWPLVYKTRAEMADFARIGAPDARVAIVEETTGLNPFVCLTNA